MSLEEHTRAEMEELARLLRLVVENLPPDKLATFWNLTWEELVDDIEEEDDASQTQ